MNRHQLNRYLFYSLGVILLTAGITLNTKTALGVSPLISLPYAVSQIWTLSFPLMTFILYAFFVILQIIIKGKNRQAKDLLQLPLSVVFSLLLDIFSRCYDSFIATLGIQTDSLIFRFALLLLAIAMTGVGAATMVAMKLIPNPADGLAEAVGGAFKKSMGFGKNFVDFSTVAITCAVGIASSGHLVGVGIGTVLAMIGVGRCIALFYHLCLDKMICAAGISQIGQASLEHA